VEEKKKKRRKKKIGKRGKHAAAGVEPIIGCDAAATTSTTQL
jgi:hypothetical protein